MEWEIINLSKALKESFLKNKVLSSELLSCEFNKIL